MHAFSGLGFTPLSTLPSTVGTTYNDTIFLTTQADISLVNNLTVSFSLTVSASASVSLTNLLGSELFLTVSASSDISFVNNATMQFTLTISASADNSFSLGIYDDTLSISGSSAVSLTVSQLMSFSITLASTTHFSIVDGQQYNYSVPIEGTSNLSLASGFVYSKSISLDVVSDFTYVELYIKQDSISLGTTADLTLEVIGNTTVSFTIAGTSSLTLIGTAVMDSSASIGATAKFYVEQIYDILIVSAAVAMISIQEKKIMSSGENPAAVGSFSASCQAQFRRTITQTLALTQTIVLKRPKAIIGQGFNLSQTISVSKSKNISVTQTLGLDQTPIGFRDVDNTLTMTQDVDYLISKRKSVSHSLNLSQTVGLNLVVNRSLSDTLTFNVPVETRLPMLSGGTPYSYYAPLIDFVLVPRKCLVILSVPSQTVVLPCPIWGDTQAYQGTLTIKRSMTGLTKTYVRQTQLQQLEYNFQLWTAKYLELRAFVMAHSYKQIRLDNWKGEGWIVNIMNNPVEFSAEGRFQPKGENYNVQLQFEGVKIHG